MSEVSSTRKSVAVILLLMVVASAISISFLTGGVPQSEAKAGDEKIKHRINTSTPQKLFESGKTSHFVNAYASIEKVQIQRGSNVTVPIIIEHTSRINDDPVMLKHFRSEVRNFLPSIGSDIEEVRNLFDRINRGETISEELPVNKYISFSEKTVKVLPNSSETILLTISIPEDFPDEALGMSFAIGLSYDVKSDKSNPISAIAGQVHVMVVA